MHLATLKGLSESHVVVIGLIAQFLRGLLWATSVFSRTPSNPGKKVKMSS